MIAQRLGRQGLLSDERGTGLIELAMILPFLALLTVGVIDLSMGFARRYELHQAVHRTIERVSANRFTAASDSDEVDYSSLKNDVAEAAGVAATDVTITTWLECDGVEMPNFDDTCDEDEPVARYLQLHVDASFDPMFTFGPVAGSANVQADGTVPLSAEAAVRIQ